ncbi:DnaJ domain-containing protein [Tanacetum coccineum]
MLTLAEMKKLAEMNVDDDEEEEEEMLTLAELKSVKTNVDDGKLKVRFKVNEKNKEHEADGDVKNLEIMTVEDSDFYDFDTGRVGKSFKKGQIWALYDDDDGMPRHYGLIEEVVSRNPFEVKMAWLDPQNNGDEGLLSLEKIGFNISCGRFKVSRKTLVQSINVFSHIVDCERAAREVYRIYPKKGSVWALYSENGLVRDIRSFDLVVFLTSYSEVHGLSMGYLEKVDGFKTIFTRREIGCKAIKWLEKHEVQLFSHPIPGKEGF